MNRPPLLSVRKGRLVDLMSFLSFVAKEARNSSRGSVASLLVL